MVRVSDVGITVSQGVGLGAKQQTRLACANGCGSQILLTALAHASLLHLSPGYQFTHELKL